MHRAFVSATESDSAGLLTNRRPNYFIDGAKSFVHRIDFTEFIKLSTKDLMNIFRKRHILVYNKPNLDHAFDRESMVDILGNLRSPTTLQGI
jgi:hypothetical protein